jgi:hypothetical protein
LLLLKRSSKACRLEPPPEANTARRVLIRSCRRTSAR